MKKIACLFIIGLFFWIPNIAMAEDVPVSDVFASAMEAELAAHQFYNSFAERFESDSDMKKTLLYFASMEVGHYKILEAEKENFEKYDDYDSW